MRWFEKDTNTVINIGEEQQLALKLSQMKTNFP